MVTNEQVEQCSCYEYEGDNPDCPIHNPKAQDDQSSDTNNGG